MKAHKECISQVYKSCCFDQLQSVETFFLTTCEPSYTVSAHIYYFTCSHTSHAVTCCFRCPFSNASIVLNHNQFFLTPSNNCTFENFRIRFITCMKPFQQDLINFWQFYNPSNFQKEFELQETRLSYLLSGMAISVQVCTNYLFCVHSVADRFNS